MNLLKLHGTTVLNAYNAYAIIMLIPERYKCIINQRQNKNITKF